MYSYGFQNSKLKWTDGSLVTYSMWNVFSYPNKYVVNYFYDNKASFYEHLQPVFSKDKKCGVLSLMDPLQPEWMLVNCDVPLTNQYICHDYTYKFFDFDPEHPVREELITSSDAVIQEHVFVCQDGTLTSPTYVCNGQIDCPMFNHNQYTDESNCTCTLNGVPVYNYTFLQNSVSGGTARIQHIIINARTEDIFLGFCLQ